jgi:hypothetical protein
MVEKEEELEIEGKEEEVEKKKNRMKRRRRKKKAKARKERRKLAKEGGRKIGRLQTVMQTFHWEFLMISFSLCEP